MPARSRDLNNTKETHPGNEFLLHIRDMSIRSLKRMYLPEKRLFVFCLRKKDDRILQEGISLRYTAIALIGLSGEKNEHVSVALHGNGPEDVFLRLLSEIRSSTNLGDVALSYWASIAIGHSGKMILLSQLTDLRPEERGYPVVELSWALTSLCMDPDEHVSALRDQLAKRLIGAFDRKAGVFPHVLGAGNGWGRSHVSCFADLVYPIQALSHYHRVRGSDEALEVAARCAEQICRLQGKSGQWWWHYDRRTGEVVENYPVYAIHQDAMGPMALFALRDAKGPYFEKELALGLKWLERSPELGGGTLVDNKADLIWRKVARREHGKISRYLQAAASRAHPSFRFPGIDRMFPPQSVDYEDRPYHLGWLLHAWPESRINSWNQGGND